MTTKCQNEMSEITTGLYEKLLSKIYENMKRNVENVAKLLLNSSC